jgi:hypothetical protein
MCLIIQSGPHLAATDIVVYKILEKIPKKTNWLQKLLGIKKYKYQTPYRSYPIELGRAYVSSLSFSDREPDTIEKGLHAITDMALNFKTAHNFDSMYWRPAKCVCVKAYIPQGATYYIGECHDIVSTALRYTKEIETSYQKAKLFQPTKFNELCV